MQPDASAFYASRPVRELFAAELAALAPILAGVYGNFGLFLRAHPSLPATLPAHLLGTVIELALDGRESCGGRLRCSPSALPLASESCHLVVAQHVLECVDDPNECSAEFSRVLAPEGVALVLGFNPVSLWRPWLAGEARNASLALGPQSARAWRQQFSRHGIEILQTRFVGAMSPWQHSVHGEAASLSARRSMLGRVGASWLLLARKRRSVLTPLRLRGSSRELSMNPRLAPGAHRECA